jgi:hypothetical protein
MHRLLAVAVISIAACRSRETMARETFSSSFTCPADRITVAPRNDLDAAALAVQPQTPPSDIAADPGRLALWKQEDERRAAQYKGASVMQVSGCDREQFYVCGELRVSVGATRPGCQSVTYPPK